MRRLSLAELEADLDDLMLLVEAGEEIVLMRDGLDVALLSPALPSGREAPRSAM